MVLVIYISLCFISFFKKKQNIIDFKKANSSKFQNIFSFLPTIGLIRPEQSL